jgi:hypothetical protein
LRDELLRFSVFGVGTRRPAAMEIVARGRHRAGPPGTTERTRRVYRAPAAPRGRIPPKKTPTLFTQAFPWPRCRAPFAPEPRRSRCPPDCITER